MNPAPDLDRDDGLEGAVDARLSTLLARIQARLAGLGHPPLPRPRLGFFDHRLDAGRATPPDSARGPGLIELNRVYLARDPEAMLRETVAHELAHLVVFHLHPYRRVSPHGALWQRIMREWLEVEPERTHRFDTAAVRARRQRRWRYRCACREHALTTVRHRRASAGSVYLCRSCHGALEPLADPP
jgi:SprT protein